MGEIVPADQLPDNIVPDDQLPDSLRPAQQRAPQQQAIGYMGERFLGENRQGDFTDTLFKGIAQPLTGVIGLANLGGGAGAATRAIEANSPNPQTEPAKALTSVMGSRFNPLSWPGRAGAVLGDFSESHGGPPALSAALRTLPEVPLTIMGARAGFKTPAGAATAVEPEAAAFTPHPLAGTAQAEAARLADITSRGQSAGLQLRTGISSAEQARDAVLNQPISDELTRGELGLPQGADLTPAMYRAGRRQYGAPAYEAARAEPSIDTSGSYLNAVAKLKKPDGAVEAPLADSMSGDELVEHLREFRDQAKVYNRDYARNGTPSSQAMGRYYQGVADALDDALEDHAISAGKPQLAQDLQNARAYYAKSFNAESATEGGHVNVTALKNMQTRKGVPLSGNLDMLATLGARYPRAFRITQDSAPPAPGLIRRGTAAVAPMLGTAGGAFVGSQLGFPTMGAVGGRALGENLSERLTGP